jgi:hypothetical protein
MCTQDVISVHCPSCGRELSYRYGILDPCRYRGQCYVRRTELHESVYRECESCAQKRRESEVESRRREAERDRRDLSAEAERDVERDRARKAGRRRVDEQREAERAAASRESRRRGEEDLEREETSRGTWTGNKRKYR